MRLGLFACVVLVTSPLATAAQPYAEGAYDDPARVGANFSFDETIWHRAPSKTGFGLILNCHLPECRPGEWPGIAGCQIAFFTQHNPRYRNTAEMARSVDLRWAQNSLAATMAAPKARVGRVTSGFRPCAGGADALCMAAALEGQGAPGLGLGFTTAKNGYRVEGECSFLEPMVERGPALFDAVLKGFRWD